MIQKIFIFFSFLSFLISPSHGSSSSFPFPYGENLLDHKKISLHVNHEKKGVVVIFLSSQCPCSHSHLSHLKELSQKYSSFTFIGIHSNVDEDPLLAKEYFLTQKLPFPILKDQNSKWANLFKAYKTPHVFVLNPKGEVVYKGGVSSSSNASRADVFYLEMALKDLQENKKIKISSARVLGCEISRN